MTALLEPVSSSLEHTVDLFARAKAGDNAALESLLREHRDAVLAVCRRRLRNAADRDDALQETMLRTVKSLDTVEDAAKLRSWMCRVAERVCLDQIRRDGRPVIEEMAELSDDEPETLTMRREDARLVRQQLQQLGERQAMALWMRDAMGEDVPAVAAQLGVTEGSARVLLSRARKQLRERWAQVAALLPAFKMPTVLSKIASLGPIGAASVLTPVIAAVVIAGSIGSGPDAGDASTRVIAPVVPAASSAASPADDDAVPDAPLELQSHDDQLPLSPVPEDAAPAGQGESTPAQTATPDAAVETGSLGTVTVSNPDDDVDNDDEIQLIADPAEEGGLLELEVEPEGVTGSRLPGTELGSSLPALPLPVEIDGL